MTDEKAQQSHQGAKMENSVNTGYLCFLILTKYLGVAVPKEAADKFVSASDPNETEANLLLLAKKLHMKSHAGNVKIKKLQNRTLPVMAEKKDGEYLLLLSYKSEGWTVLDPIKKAPEVISTDELSNLITGHILIFGKKGKPAEADPKKFGFRWFIPTILRFKKQFIGVLIAVFVVQLIGILTPLMTQVVVDKVLSHHARSTLMTIAIGSPAVRLPIK